MAKKRNPQDATLRNTRSLDKRVDALERFQRLVLELSPLASAVFAERLRAELREDDDTKPAPKSHPWGE